MKDETSQCILNNFQLENLRRHVYRSTGKTVLDPYMQVCDFMHLFSVVSNLSIHLVIKS